MHPNLHQYLQQSSLTNAGTTGIGGGGGNAATAGNPLTSALQPTTNASNNLNALSQHFSAMNRNVAAGVSSAGGAGGLNTADPFMYAQMMNNNLGPQGMPMPSNYLMQQQQQHPSQAQQQQPSHVQQQQQDHQQKMQQLDEEKIYGLVLDLLNPSTREQALLDLSKKREQYEDLALVLWYSYGVIPVLLQEIVTVYSLLTPPTLSGGASNRVCNALALLQCVANHNETRSLFLQAHIPLYLYPFLNTTSKTRPFEYLRLTSLGVIGALVKNDNPEVISFLLSTEIIPLCLRIMETGSELSKTVAIFVVQKILLDDTGLYYICQTYERFYAVATVLHNMVNQLVENQAMRLLKHVIRCYLRLSENPRAREALRQCLPEPLRDTTFHQILKDDLATKRCLGQLLLNLSDGMN
ncbi:cell differentiation family, Rcd1-like-domain-containing protein [Mycotypha africana]|uniref:cell differentiation family, Rcd1-like-domain-containing protein n=1 Tax=Mycotypha africana TaxID=64632 RepID=UPI002300A5B7|nr:cell differentiation family, Rcd1-like-domain-containing protein [Mycotypha africana]KAI8992018.1 cell differentiation family, Rcd1-like-domain-containing protein [Mycotypha africana]